MRRSMLAFSPRSRIRGLVQYMSQQQIVQMIPKHGMIFFFGRAPRFWYVLCCYSASRGRHGLCSLDVYETESALWDAQSL